MAPQNDDLRPAPRHEVRSGAPSLGLVAGILVLALVLIGLFWWAADDTGTTVTLDQTTEQPAPAAPPAAMPETAPPAETTPPAATERELAPEPEGPTP